MTAANKHLQSELRKSALLKKALPKKELRKYKSDNESAEAARHIIVWDLPVRVFHWALVIAIVAAYVTNKLGVSYFKYHVWCGYAVIVLVSFRLVWGIIGTRHARFWNFVRGPIATLRYTRGLVRGREQRYTGHNPLGALMVLLLLAALLVQSLTGLFGNDEIFNVGPLYGYVSNELSLQLTSVHRQLFYWLAGAVAIHIVAVLAHYVFKRENLVAAMFTGRKPQLHANDGDGIRSSRTWVAAILIVASSAGLAWVVMHAPTTVSDISSY